MITDTLDIKWNFTSAMHERLKKRISWNNNFEKNSQKFANELSVTIVNLFMEKVDFVIRNAQYECYYNEPISSTFSFKHINSDMAKLKELAPKQSEKKPFKEWIELLTNPQQEQEVENENLPGPKNHVPKDIELDVRYFFDKMVEIAIKVENNLNEIFKVIQSRPGNSVVKFEVIRRSVLTIEIKMWTEVPSTL